MRSTCFVMAMTLALSQGLPAAARSCGAPAEAKPHRWTGGESFPPLPLPATPLRRSEKKRPPSPPALIAKIQYGKKISGVDEHGRRYTYLDWTTDPNDCKNLLKRAISDLSIRYRTIEVPFSRFSFDPGQIPIAYLTGHEALSLDDETRKKLRWYLQDGGFLICDACCGSDDFLKGWMREMGLMFPRRKVRTLSPDHPIFRCFYKIKEVGYMVEGKDPFRAPPTLLGINIGCRTAVILSPYDLSCGWDDHCHETGKRIWPAEDAKRIGINIISYALATYKLGRFLAVQKNYFDAEEELGDALMFGQVVHGGDWDPDPSALINLLKLLAAESTIDVKFRRAVIELDKKDIFACPILYMTGHYDFRLTQAEAANLAKYLAGGGVLIADACCGSIHFDAAFRREIAKVLPGRKLELLPPDHELFRASGEQVGRVQYTSDAAAELGGLDAPVIEGIELGGSLVVIYSRYDIGCGLEGEECPFCKGYSQKDARRLAKSMVVYAMTH